MTRTDIEIEKRRNLAALFENVDEKEKSLVYGLICQAAFCETRLEELKGMDFIAVHPRDPGRTKATPAAKQYKDLAGTYANIIRILLNVLRKVESDAQDELLKRLEEFSI